MGNGISSAVFPKVRAVSYEDRSRLTSAGICHEPFSYKVGEANHLFDELTESVFKNVLHERKLILAAKLKYQDMNVDSIQERYPQWTYDQIMDLKAQFQTFDINQDGLIDFQELCHALDEMGDQSDKETRRRCFEELDDDDSGAVDFDEFLQLIHSFMSGKMGGQAKIGQLCKTSTETSQRLRKLSIVEQIEHGLF